MKLLWVSNAAFTRTGYGTGTQQVTQQMLKEGKHTPIVLAYWGLQGATVEIEGVDHVSPRSETWANDCMGDYREALECDAILIHRDIWVNDVSVAEKHPVAAWFPLDHEPVDEKILRHMRVTRWMATMSRWAQELFREAGFDVKYIPHSINPEVFKYDRSREARKLHNIPDDAFLATVVAANKGYPSRKAWPEIFLAFAEFQKRHPDAWLYCHTNPTPEETGPDLVALSNQCGVDANRVRFLNPVFWYLGIQNDELATFYSMSDVLLNPSYGEGFGIPILEAQACGTPVITGDNSSMPEITFNGWSVEGEKYWIPYSWWKAPKVGAIVDALEAAYSAKDSPRAIIHAEQTAESIAEFWSDEAVYKKYWVPFLTKMEADLS